MKFAKLFRRGIHRFLVVPRLGRLTGLWLFLPFVLLRTAYGSPPLDINSPQVQVVMAIQDRVTDEWMRQSEVLGTAVGLDSDGLPALVVFIDREAPRAAEIVDSLPKSIDSIKVLPKLTGKFRALRGDAVLGGHTGIQTPPIQLGTSGGWRFDQGNDRCCGGTLGALVAIGSTQYILSNYHVLEGHGAQTGASIIQPGLGDVGCNANNAQTVATFLTRNSLPSSNVDCAIAQVVPGMVRTDGSILEVGAISSQTLSAALGQNVKKSGRTTGLTHSNITWVNGKVTIGYSSQCAGPTAFQKTFTGQIFVANSDATFSCRGDSGSLLLEDVPTNPRAIGLLFAGNQALDDPGCTTGSIAIANPIGEVLSFLGASMVGGGTPPSNDQCSGAITLFNGEAQTQSTVNATSTGDPGTTTACSSPAPLSRGVWYKFTPTSNGTVTVSTCDGSDYDTVLEVYTGTCAGSRTAIACEDDDGPICSGQGSPASVTFNGTGGTTYLILAASWGSTGAGGTLRIEASTSSTPTPTPSETISTPATPSGPSNGSPGTVYSYSASGASSNLGHTAQYQFSWGDGSTSNWLPVGTTSASHSWSSSGTYSVRAQARCATHTSIMSAVSGTLSVTIGSTPSCPATITQSSSQTITSQNSVRCGNTGGHTNNSYWRAFNMATFTGSQQYNITSVSFGIEVANDGGGAGQPVTVRLYTNSGAAFPGGTRSQIATTTVTVMDSAAGTVLNVPLAATVPTGTSELIMEVFTPDGAPANHSFFIGSNASAETGPSYISAASCGIDTPTPTGDIGFPNTHIVFNVNGSCGGTTPTPTPPEGGSLVVTNMNSQGAGSLASAIASANSNPSPKTISFNLQGSGPWPITVSSPLVVTAQVIIDGTTQPGYNNGSNRVYVEGPGVGRIFEFRNHANSKIRGLGVNNYGDTGILIDNATAIWVEDCYIGFKQTSSGVLLNRTQAPFSTGIGIRGSLNQVHRSTVSGVYNGIIVGEPNDQVTGFVSNDNLFEGNNIGTDPTGQTTVGYENTSNGISLLAGAKSSWIGGWTFPEPPGFNVIAGNGGSGILISHPTADHNRVFSNYLGLNRGGTAVITGSTNQQGILIENGAHHNAAWSNIISGNRSAGIIVASSDNWILGNFIGLNQAQTQPLGGQPYGVLLKIDTLHTPGIAPQRNAIGGSDENPPHYSYGNVISNQSLNGIEIQNGVGNGVMCNWIGINTAGQPFPNGGWGAYLLNSSFNSDYGCRNAWGPNGNGRVGGSGGTGNSIQ